MEEEKLKILFVLPFLPWPLSSGGHQAVFNGIKALSGRAELHLVYYAGQFDKGAENRRALSEALGGKADIIPYVDKLGRWNGRIALKRFLVKFHKKLDSKGYVLYTRLHDQNYYSFVNSLVCDLAIDLVQVDMIENLDFALSLPEDVKKVFVHHELRYVRNRQFIKEWKGGDEYLKTLAELEKIKEIGLLNKYDTIITFSETDKDKLLSEGVSSPVVFSAPVVDTAPSFCKADPSKTVSYVGPEAHFPNKLGLIWFLDKVWPRILEADPSFKLNILGKWSSGTALEWNRKYKNICFKGFVENLAEAVSGTTMIVPVFVGSGIRMKILESMSIGVPFVSTKVGAEGIPLESGRDCYITDDAEEFAKAVQALEDKSLRQSFAESARLVLEQNYTLEVLSAERIKLYENLVKDA